MRWRVCSRLICEFWSPRALRSRFIHKPLDMVLNRLMLQTIGESRLQSANVVLDASLIHGLPLVGKTVNQTTMKLRIQNLFILLALLAGSHQVAAQGTTAFTYQGQLRDGGTNANGAYTMIFKLYDAVTIGNQVGTAITNSPTLANGLFSVNLDFGNVFDGNARWLDITVQSGTNAAETLTPRVQVLPVPYAQFAAVAATVTNGAIMNAQLAGNAVNTTNIQNNAVTTTQIASGAVTNRNLTANAVNATNIANGQVVKGLNGLADNVVFTAGANVALFTNGNTLQFSAGVPNIQVFYNSNAIFVVPTNVTRIMVEMWGGGGGGGAFGNASVTSGNVTTFYAGSGGGGGAGGYAWNVFTVTPGASYTVSPGSRGYGGGLDGSGQGYGGSGGGTSSFGNLITAGGGVGGQAGRIGPGAGGAGGTVTGSLANNATTGDNGESGNGDGSGNGSGGVGGSVWRGGGGKQNGPGGGGNGGESGDHAGNDGKLGVIIVYY